MSGRTDQSDTEGIDRRSVLRGVGAAGASLAASGVASGSVLADGPDVPLRVNVWFTRDAERGHVGDAVRDLADQLGVEADLTRKGELGFGKDDFETFGELAEKFDARADKEEGAHNLLIHYKDLPDEDIPIVGYDGCSKCNPNGGNLFDDYAGGGLSLGSYRAGNTPTSMVNSALEVGPVLTTDAYRNLIKHELLHGMLDSKNCPQNDVDDEKNSGGWREHSYGTVFDPPWWKFWDTASASPMLTGYVEPASSNVPHHNNFDKVCGGGTPQETYTHDPELSECTRQEARRWLREEYDPGAASTADSELASRTIEDGQAHTFEYAVDRNCAHTVELDGPEEADLDLYVTVDGRTPTPADSDRSSWGYGSDERVELDADELGGSLGIRVHSRLGGGEYTLTVEPDC